MPEMIEKDGQQVEVFTQAELDAKVAEAKAAGADPAKLQEVQTQLDAATKERDDLKQRISVAGEKDANFATLRQELSKKDEVIAALGKKVDEAVQTVQTSIHQSHINDSLDTLAQGDVELRKKIQFNYDRLTDKAGTKEEITAKMTSAYVLATGSNVPDRLRTAIGFTGGRPTLDAKGNKSPITEHGLDIGSRMLGVSEADIKKAQDKGLI